VPVPAASPSAPPSPRSAALIASAAAVGGAGAGLGLVADAELRAVVHVSSLRVSASGTEAVDDAPVEVGAL
jgi:hypothetical protein